MKRIIRMGLGALAVWSLSFAPAFSSEALAFKRTEVGQTAYDFTLETLEGSQGTLSELLGEKATIIVFWAAWSPRSLDLLTDVQKYAEEHADKGLKAVAVNAEHQEWDPAALSSITEMAKKANVSFPVLLDKNLAIYDEYGVIAMPSAVLVDGERKVVSLVMSYGTFSRYQFKEEIDRVLGLFVEKPVAEVEKSYEPKGLAERYLKMAQILMQRKRYSRAIDPLEKAMAEDPEYAAVYRTLAEVYTHMEKPEEAAAATQKAEQWEAVHGAPAPAAKEAPMKKEGADSEGPSSEAKPAGDGSHLVPIRKVAHGA